MEMHFVLGFHNHSPKWYNLFYPSIQRVIRCFLTILRFYLHEQEVENQIFTRKVIKTGDLRYEITFECDKSIDDLECTLNWVRDYWETVRQNDLQSNFLLTGHDRIFLEYFYPELLVSGQFSKWEHRLQNPQFVGYYPDIIWEIRQRVAFFRVIAKVKHWYFENKDIPTE